jgi:hypothetical protein
MQLTIINYKVMRTETNLSDNYRMDIISLLCMFPNTIKKHEYYNKVDVL